MSTMRANLLANAAGTGSPDIVGGELSRARWNLNGTGTIAARDTFNISSFIDNGVGNYSAVYAIAMPNSDYSFAISGQDGSVVALTSGVIAAPPTVSQMNQASYNGSVIATDTSRVSGAIFGDKP